MGYTKNGSLAKPQRWGLDICYTLEYFQVRCQGVGFSWEKTLERGGESPKITPWKINMEHVLMEVWKIIFLSQWLINRFHVILPGCRYSQTDFQNERIMIRCTQWFLSNQVASNVSNPGKAWHIWYLLYRVLFNAHINWRFWYVGKPINRYLYGICTIAMEHPPYSCILYWKRTCFIAMYVPWVEGKLYVDWVYCWKNRQVYFYEKNWSSNHPFKIPLSWEGFFGIVGIDQGNPLRTH